MESDRKLQWRGLALAFGLAAAVLVIRAVTTGGTVPLFGDTDDAMRLVEVHDLIAGQGWYDLVQHRLNTPYGASMHWSRLVDLPIAALIVILRPFAGASADTVAGYIWPLLLLSGLFWLNLRLAMRLVGQAALLPALALPAFSLVTIVEFAPGRLDHHSVQILLLLATLLGTIRALEHPRAALGAGLAAAATLAIGVESLPTVLAAVLAFGILWVLNPARAHMLRLFGIGFAVSMLVLLALAQPPERWLVPACDAISSIYALAAVGVGVAFVALSVLPVTGCSPLLRLVLGGVAGAILLIGLLLLFPGCLGGPYAMLDPWLVTNWINNIAEAKPFWTTLFVEPAYAVAVGVPTLLALAVAAFRLLRGPAEGREAWLVYAVFLLLALLVMLVQVRAARLAASLVVPAGAYAVTMARSRYLATPKLRETLLLVGSWLGFAGIALGTVTGFVAGITSGDSVAAVGATSVSRNACKLPQAFTEIADGPPQRIMTQVDLGAHVLAFTPHSVVSAPYHRDVAGLHDAFDFFNGPLDDARAILDRRGIDLVVVCPALPELGGLGEVAPDAFNRLFAANRLPDWLRDEIPPDGVLRIFRVVPEP